MYVCMYVCMLCLRTSQINTVDWYLVESLWSEVYKILAKRRPRRYRCYFIPSLETILDSFYWERQLKHLTEKLDCLLDKDKSKQYTTLVIDRWLKQPWPSKQFFHSCKFSLYCWELFDRGWRGPDGTKSDKSFQHLPLQSLCKPPGEMREFMTQNATAFRSRWPGKSLERGRRCKHGKFKLRFATPWGQYQYINPYKGFDEKTKKWLLFKKFKNYCYLVWRKKL